MATTTPNFGWAVPTSTDLVKDGAVAIETLGDAIDASLVDLKGGTTNQVLAKNSNTDMDFKWVADASGIPATILDAKGDLIAATAADTASRLAVGANGTVLTADSAEATGLKWATAASGGGMTLLSTTTLSGSSVTLSSISQSYKTLHLEIKGARSNTGADLILIRFNSDTGNNYENRRWTVEGSTGTGSQGANQDYIRFAGIGTSSTVTEVTNGQIDIFRYTDTSNINISSNGAGNDGSKTIIMNQGRYIASAAITSITIGLTAYTFAAGTAYLYGVN